MSNVTKFRGITIADIPPDTILEAATGKLDSTLVIGWDHDGNLYVASTSSSPGEIMWLMESAKKYLLEILE